MASAALPPESHRVRPLPSWNAVRAGLFFLLVPATCGWLLSVALSAAPNLLPQEIRISESADPNGSIWREYDPYMDDFVVFFAAGTIARDDPSGLYNVDEMHEREADVLGADPIEVIRLPFFNPPPYVTPFLLLSLLPLGLAATVWTLAGLGSMSATLALIWERARERDQLLLITMAGTVVSMPFHEVVLHGQVTLFLALAIAGFYWGAIAGNRTWVTAMSLAVLALKPQLVIAPIGFLIITRRNSALAKFALLEVGILAVGALLLGARAYLGWATLMIEAIGWEDSNGIWTHAMFGWNAFVRALAGPGLPVVRAGATLLFVSATALFAVQQWRRRLPSANQFAVIVFASLLMSPHLFAQDLLLAAVPLLVLISLGQSRALWTVYGASGWFLTYLHFNFLLPSPDQTGVNFVTLWLMAGLILAAMPAGESPPSLARQLSKASTAIRPGGGGRRTTAAVIACALPFGLLLLAPRCLSLWCLRRQRARALGKMAHSTRYALRTN